MLGSHVLGGAPNPPAVGTCANLMGNGGRNTVMGPGRVTFDFSLLKNTYIRRVSETFNAQFRAQFFNIFNRPLSLIQEHNGQRHVSGAMDCWCRTAPLGYNAEVRR